LHVIVVASQTWPRAQSESTHDAPTAGDGPQVPHTAFFSPVQKVLLHWALKAQAAPLTREPAG
jgi:hypothetical protein